MRIEALINALTEYAIINSLIQNCDKVYARNLLLACFEKHEWEDCTEVYPYDCIDDILNEMVEYAVSSEIITDTNESRDLFDTKIMGVLCAFPREIIAKFKNDYDTSPATATDNYYDYSKKLNYVRAGRIAKDLKWKFDCDYGTLDITINCSKPEKDPRDIANAGKAVSTKYPKCQLCIDNSGYQGRIGHNARQNLVPIPMNVLNENWFFQYSPYGYYNEHCIIFNEKHIPMQIDDDVFKKLFDITEILPHYFVGSNADLPIVGGSILSHEHFQGGNYTFAMEKAESEFCFKVDGFDDVECSIIKWPMSVIRVDSSNRSNIEKLCAHILKKWRAYSDDNVGIYSHTGDIPHNTITPIVRKRGELFECDLVLRNNITTEDRPLGVFHPNPALHHIKKENIGLIEVMGLAVLPARLSKELPLLEKALLEKRDISDDSTISMHSEWLNAVSASYDDINENNVRMILENEIGKVFLEVLMDAGVFKRDAKGFDAFKKFVSIL
ncbi:MAG: UDP-glucose--hexose-1-phosphate uridylyltransferase [Oscillospiraceae bacterium]|nr:UDP-glucose--hexose-1-phosphate uridylyltransferase [Oscillospiraceae bacterium]